MKKFKDTVTGDIVFGRIEGDSFFYGDGRERKADRFEEVKSGQGAKSVDKRKASDKRGGAKQSADGRVDASVGNSNDAKEDSGGDAERASAPKPGPGGVNTPDVAA